MRIVRALWMVFLSVVAGLALATTASADSSSEYGEVIRFGGFDSSAYNGGQYGGTPTPGKFLDPTGFAVDTQDNTVYVIDRTSSYKHNPTSWRIQEFSPAGDVLGTTTFTLPNGNFGAYAITGLAVDHRAERLYALVIGPPPLPNAAPDTPVAQELLAWSTTSNSHGELQAAPSLANDPLHTTGGLVSSREQLQSSASSLLHAPQGITIDPLDNPGVDNPVAIEASDLSGTGNGKPIPGGTVVQQIETDGSGIGSPLKEWSGSSLASELGANWGPLGISTNPDGTITALLDASNLSATNAYVVRLDADLTHPVVLNGDTIEPPIGDFDQAPMWIDESPFSTVVGIGISYVYGAGTEVVQLSTAASGAIGGLYAADIFSQSAGKIGENTDVQFSPTVHGPEYWVSGTSQYNYESNIGVRLLQPAVDHTIVDTSGHTIVNTLGNVVVGGACNLDAPEAVLAAGSTGTLWVLDKGPKSSSPAAAGVGRQVIELAPGIGRLCPQPSGTFMMTPEGGSSQSGGETLKIAAGTQVTFDASTISLQGGKPFAYEWDLDGNATNGPKQDGFEMVNEIQSPEYYFPPATATYKYTQPGRYTVRARLRSDYGVYAMPSATVIVTGPAHPHADFTVTSPPGSQQATFNAATSTAGVGTIVNYHWSWGDGSAEDEGQQGPTVAHTYAQPGSYTVTLTVTNSSYQSATSAPQTVTVEAKPPATDPIGPLIAPLATTPPPIYAIPAPAPSRGPTRLSTRLSIHARFVRGLVTVKLSCPATKASCAGDIRVETEAAFVARKKRTHRRRENRLLLGQAPFTVSGGADETVSVRLSANGVALLKRLKHLNALVIVSAHDSLGDPGAASLRLALSAAVLHAHR
jgi:PKD repeat protein